MSEVVGTDLRSDTTSEHATADLLAVITQFAELPFAHRTWAALAERCLLFCRRHADLWADVHLRSATAAVEARAALFDDACEAVGAGGSPLADANQVTKLLGLVVQARAEWPDEAPMADVLLSRALALAVEELRWETFEPTFRLRLTLQIAVDQAYPVAGFDPRPFLGPPGGRHSANTAPARHPTHEIDALPHLRLGDPLAARYRILIDWDAWGRLSPLSDAAARYRLRIATLHPNVYLSEYDYETAVTASTFRNHGPLDPDRQHFVLSGLLEKAAELEADVLVIPEYALHEDHRDVLKAVFERLSPRPSLVLAGSSETLTDDERVVNQAVLWTQGNGVFALPKIFAAEFLGLKEGISPDVVPEVTIYRSRLWTISGVICRDAAAEELIDVFGHVGVTLFLVPACTNRIGTMAQSACTLACRSQAFVAIANASGYLFDDDAASAPSLPDAVFGGPYEQYTGPLEAPGPDCGGRPPIPGLWLFDSGARTATWHSL